MLVLLPLGALPVPLQFVEIVYTAVEFPRCFGDTFALVRPSFGVYSSRLSRARALALCFGFASWRENVSCARTYLGAYRGAAA